MRVLVGCEFSQRVTKAFRKKGHDAYSCDIEDTEGNPEWHIKGDVLDHLKDGWDLAILHPPCTYLANSGVRWLYTETGEKVPGRWEDMQEAAEFFKLLLDAPVNKICVENPIPHKWARDIIQKQYTQTVQPWQFGEGKTKCTCLWLKNLPPLRPSNIVEGREPEIHNEPPGEDRQKNRSRTYQGIAEAMAEQWGKPCTLGDFL